MAKLEVKNSCYCPFFKVSYLDMTLCGIFKNATKTRWFLLLNDTQQIFAENAFFLENRL
jgi:hypothetical protein